MGIFVPLFVIWAKIVKDRTILSVILNNKLVILVRNYILVYNLWRVSIVEDAHSL